MNLLPPVILFLLLMPSSAPLVTSAPPQLQIPPEVDGLASCLARLRVGTAVDRWLACLETEQDVNLEITASGPDRIEHLRVQSALEPQLVGTLEESSTTEQLVIEDGLDFTHPLGDLAQQEEVSGAVSSLVGSTLVQQHEGLEPQLHMAYAGSDGAPIDAGDNDLQLYRTLGNQLWNLPFPSLAINLCGFLLAMLVGRLWKCRQLLCPQANIQEAETLNTPTAGVAAVGKKVTGTPTECSAKTLSKPLGMAIGTVVAKVLEHNREVRQDLLSADQVSKLLEVALEAQLLPVMGTACRAFVVEVKDSFSSTFHTLQSVWGVVPRLADMECSRSENLCGTASCSELPRGPAATGQHHRVQSWLHMPVHEKSPMHIPSRDSIRPVSEVVSGTPDADEACSDTEVPWLVVRKRQRVTAEVQRTLEAEDACSQTAESYLDAPLEGQIVQENRGVPYSVSPATDSFWLATPSLGPCLSSERPMQQAWLDVLERSVHVQEQRNYYKQLQIMQKMKHTSLKEEKLQVSLESNQILKQNVGLSLETNQIMRQTADLTRTRALLKERESEERRLLAGYLELKKTCADELTAGLCVMLMSLGYGGWTYSYERLSKLVSSCQPVKGRRRSLWMGGSWYQSALDSLTGLACEVTVAGRMVAGISIIVLVSYVLLRRSVTASSQAMPVSVIVIVFGVICGIAGKLSVDFLGGSGLYWLLFWESLCLVHAVSSCFTSFLYRCLHGCSPQSLGVSKRGRLMWFRPFVFHSSLVLLIPLLAGLVPFAPFRDLLYGLLVVVIRAISRIKPEHLSARVRAVENEVML